MWPFLDPLAPIPEAHIQRAAKRLRLSEPEVRDLLAACENVLGYNPLEGGRAKLEG